VLDLLEVAPLGNLDEEPGGARSLAEREALCEPPQAKLRHSSAADDLRTPDFRMRSMGRCNAMHSTAAGGLPGLASGHRLPEQTLVTTVRALARDERPGSDLRAETDSERRRKMVERGARALKLS
jgi:hypothetical protein